MPRNSLSRGSKWKQYKQKYRSTWEAIPEMKDWLEPVPENPHFARCSFCGIRLEARKKGLMSHTKSKKHVESIKSFDKVELLRVPIGVKQLRNEPEQRLAVQQLQDDEDHYEMSQRKRLCNVLKVAAKDDEASPPPVAAGMLCDEEGYFGESVACALRRFRPYKKALAKVKINQLLLELEFETETTHILTVTTSDLEPRAEEMQA